MIIQADKEGKAVINQLGELAIKYAGFEIILKQLGIQAMPNMARVLNSVTLLPEPKPEPKKEPSDNGKTSGAAAK